MKKFISVIVFIIVLLTPNVIVFAGSSCLTDPKTRNNYYNGRRQGDNLTNWNNRTRMENSTGPEWVQRQERQNYRLHQFKRQHSDFTENHWN